MGGLRSEILAEDRPANVDRYFGRSILGHDCTKIRNNERRQAGQHESIHWPPIFGHCSTKIRNTDKRPPGQHKSIHRPPMFGHGVTKIRNTGKRTVGQHKSIHRPQVFGHGLTKIRMKDWPTNLGPLLDQDQKYWPKIAGMDWYWTNIDPLVCADWVSATSLVQNNCTLW